MSPRDDLSRLALGFQAERQDDKKHQRPDDRKQDKTRNRTQGIFLSLSVQVTNTPIIVRNKG